jgi:protoporphyrinogen oxidase
VILILGGGLAGMATAYHLARLLPGVPRLVLEKEAVPGGLARSRSVGGFTFDFTGHYLHLREPETIALVDEWLGPALVPVERRAYIHARGARLDFPFQANLHGLPPDVVARCLVDFVAASRLEPPPQDGRMPFGQWARRVFGDGIAEEFMIPYNAKLYGVDPDDMTAEWVAWSVPRPDVASVIRGALGLRNEGLGYNPRFLYPRAGGIGVLPAALAERVAGDLRCGAAVQSIDAREKRVILEGGEVLPFERLVSTLPLTYLLQRTRGLDSCQRRDHARTLAELAGRLRFTAVIELALGVRRPGIADGAHWIYFPEPAVPFYRVGFPSNVAASLAPAGCSSVSVEFPHRPGDPVPGAAELCARARPALEAAGVLLPGDEIVVADVALLDPAYVIFDPRCTDTVGEALARLRRAGVLSIGRFGAWTYSYMERALIDGREAARELAATYAAERPDEPAAGPRGE